MHSKKKKKKKKKKSVRVCARARNPVPWLSYILAIWQTWKQLYPTDELPAVRRTELEQVEASIPDFVHLLLTHRSPALHGQRLGDLWPAQERGPARLLRLYESWRGDLQE